MPRIWTFVAVEVEAASRGADVARARSTIESAGGEVVGSEEIVLARFPLAMDAVHSVLLLRGAGNEPGIGRAAVHTGAPADADGIEQATASGLAVARWLLDQARPGQTVVTAMTAALAGPALPTTVELVALSSDDAERLPQAGRIHELRPVPIIEDSTGRSDPGRAPAPSNLAWAHRAAASPVVGRGRELGILMEAWRATLRGERRLMSLVGEPGTGKTAVAAEMALRVHATGALVLYGRWDREQATPYAAFREALGTHAAARPDPGLRAELEGDLDKIRRLLPDVAARLGHVEEGVVGDPDGERAALYDAVAAWLDRLAADRPVLLVLDDHHWADRSSQRLLDHLRCAVGPSPWTALVTVRPVAQPAAQAGQPPATGGSPGEGAVVDMVELAGLDVEAICQLVQRTLGLGLDPDHETVTWLSTATAGNALLVQQVLDGVRGSVDALSELRIARDQLPRPLTDVVRWRLGHLPERLRRIMADAAVLGTDIDLEVLSETLSRPSVLLRDALQPAVDEHLLRVEADGQRYTFAHDVVRRALLDLVPAGRAGDVHRRVAAALEARVGRGPAPPIGDIAHHRLAGADGETAAMALEWARRGARAAQDATAYDEAVDLLDRAVAVHDRLVRSVVPGDPLACELRLELAEAHDMAGQSRIRDERFLDAADLARSLGRTDLFCRAALGYGGLLPAAAMPDLVASGLIEEALDRLPDADSPPRALLTARLAQFRYFEAPSAARRQLADTAVGIARRLGEPVTLARTLMSRVLALDGAMTVDDVTATADEVTRIGEETGDADLVLQGLRVRVTSLLAEGHPRQARDVAATFTRRAKEARHQEHARVAFMWDIFWAGFEGRYDDVERLTAAATEMLDRTGHRHAALIPYAYSIVPRWLHGHMDLARPVVEFLHAADPESPCWWAQSMWCDAATGHVAQALARLDEREPRDTLAAIPHDIMRWPTLVPWAVVAAYGHRAWADALYQYLLPDAGRLAVSGFAMFGGAVDHHLGALALVLNRPAEAVERLDRALAGHRSLGMPGFVGLSAHWLALAHRRRSRTGDDQRALALLDEVALLVNQYGLHGLRDPEGSADPLGVPVVPR